MFQELKEDNRVLQETKEVLEDQLEGWRARSDKIHQLEKHGLLLKARVHDMEQVRHLHTYLCVALYSTSSTTVNRDQCNIIQKHPEVSISYLLLGLMIIWSCHLR